MKPILFTIGFLPIYSQFLILGLSYSIALIIGYFESKREKVDFARLGIFAALQMLLGGVIGGKLVWMFMNRQEISFIYSKKGFVSAIKFTLFGGTAYIGVIIFAIFSVYIFTKIKKESFWKYMDIISISFFYASSFGRWGCFLAGCCFGKQMDSVFGVLFETHKKLINYPVHPTQIYESWAVFLIFSITRNIRVRKILTLQEIIAFLSLYSLSRLVWLYWASKIGFSVADIFVLPAFFSFFLFLKFIMLKLTTPLSKSDYEGQLFLFSFVLYCVARFFLEYLRHPAGITGWIIVEKLSTTHILIAVILPLCILTMIFRRIRVRGSPPP